LILQRHPKSSHSTSFSTLWKCLRSVRRYASCGLVFTRNRDFNVVNKDELSLESDETGMNPSVYPHDPKRVADADAQRVEQLAGRPQREQQLPSLAHYWHRPEARAPTRATGQPRARADPAAEPG